MTPEKLAVAGLRVKPLVWSAEWEGEYTANTPFGDALVRVRGHLGGQSIVWWGPQDDGDWTGSANTVEAAKAAAQADYAARILAALEDVSDE